MSNRPLLDLSSKIALGAAVWACRQELGDGAKHFGHGPHLISGSWLMAESDTREVPQSWLWLIRAASWILPRPLRQRWRETRQDHVREWWSFLETRGVKGAGGRVEVLRYCRKAFADAVAERYPAADIRSWARRLIRGPRAVMGGLLILLALAAGSTGFFSDVRTLFARLPFKDSERLVTCYQVHFLSMSLGVQARYIQPWRRNSRELARIAAYQVHAFGLEGKTVDGARVTSDFFDVLGVTSLEGRTFGPHDSPIEPLAVLSYRLWKDRAASDPRAHLGWIALDGQRFRVIGVLPPDFWFKSRQLEIWTLLPDPGQTGQSPGFVGAIGRLRPGATPETARAELERIDRRTSRFQGGALRVVPVEKSLRPVLQFAFAGLVVGLVLAAGLTLVQIGRAWRKRFGSPGCVSVLGFLLPQVEPYVDTLGAAVRRGFGLERAGYPLLQVRPRHAGRLDVGCRNAPDLPVVDPGSVEALSRVLTAPGDPGHAWVLEQFLARTRRYRVALRPGPRLAAYSRELLGRR